MNFIMENTTMNFFYNNFSSNHTIDTNSSFNYTNDVKDNNNLPEIPKLVKDILIVATVIIIMMSMGADICWDQIWNHVRRPFAVLIGIFCQFIVMPLSGYTYKHIFQLEAEVATGLLIISCTPGGILSNIFTYYLNGDVSLSVSMTTISTVLALGMMPLNVWLYATREASHLVIPFGNMALSLVMITSPALVGMIIRWKFPRASVYITKWGSAIGFLIFITSFLIELISFRHVVHQIPLKLIITTILMPTTGIIAGYLIGFLCKRSNSISTTIAVESGIQNVPVAISIISLSFDITHQTNLIMLPWFYLISQVVICGVICAVYHIVRIFMKRKEVPEEKQEKVIEIIEITSL
ncbi:solute carrier family 10 member 6-like [Centruroides sculpturatus]|uniref:solute carrier family 10 member 6-like n=1 Tax=Centruroides sculpturatus TaxID=218467 RepID=UPI000C6ECE00|nr:solute carrier family 10 member 6-like [Centruroides sculpturatus]